MNVKISTSVDTSMVPLEAETSPTCTPRSGIFLKTNGRWSLICHSHARLKSPASTCSTRMDWDSNVSPRVRPLLLWQLEASAGILKLMFWKLTSTGAMEWFRNGRIRDRSITRWCLLYQKISPHFISKQIEEITHPSRPHGGNPLTDGFYHWVFLLPAIEPSFLVFRLPCLANIFSSVDRLLREKVFTDKVVIWDRPHLIQLRPTFKSCCLILNHRVCATACDCYSILHISKRRPPIWSRQLYWRSQRLRQDTRWQMGALPHKPRGCAMDCP